MHPEVPELDDDALLAAVRDGDAVSLEVLYRRHEQLATRVARRAGAGPTDVDDVVAEAYAKLLRAVQRGRGPEDNFPAYLALTVRRVAWALQHQQSRSRPTDDLDVLDHVEAEELEELGETAAGAALAALPEESRALLWRLEVEGERVSDVARDLGKSPNAVSAAATRARRRLRKEYRLRADDA